MQMHAAFHHNWLTLDSALLGACCCLQSTCSLHACMGIDSLQCQELLAIQLAGAAARQF
jgi:hypothetical protein